MGAVGLQQLGVAAVVGRQQGARLRLLLLVVLRVAWLVVAAAGSQQRRVSRLQQVLPLHQVQRTLLVLLGVWLEEEVHLRPARRFRSRLVRRVMQGLHLVQVARAPPPHPQPLLATRGPNPRQSRRGSRMRDLERAQIWACGGCAKPLWGH